MRGVECLKNDINYINNETSSAVRLAARHSGLLDLFCGRREEERVGRFLREPLLRGMTYEELGDEILRLAARVSRAERRYQQSVRQDAPGYYDHIDEIVEGLHGLLEAYIGLMPKAASHRVALADGRRMALSELVETRMNAELIKMDIPQQHAWLIRQVARSPLFS